MDLFHAMASLCGSGPSELPPEANRLREEIGEARHYLFILLDGLGMNLRNHYPRHGFFNSHFHRELRAIFPSTTTSVLVSLATGLWPAEHGITGWFTHLPAAGFTFVPLLFSERFTEAPLSDLGLDVHDVGSKYEPFKKGMVLTCEPGLYIKEEGIGIRIENDIIVDDIPVDLMADIPREVADIEQLMA